MLFDAVQHLEVNGSQLTLLLEERAGIWTGTILKDRRPFLGPLRYQSEQAARQDLHCLAFLESSIVHECDGNCVAWKTYPRLTR